MRVDEYPAHEGAAPATGEIIDPEVSTRSMKYGFDTAGHALGSGKRQLAGSAWAGAGEKSAATVRTVAATAAGVGTDRKRKRAMGAPWGALGAFTANIEAARRRIDRGLGLRGAAAIFADTPRRNEMSEATASVSRAPRAPQGARRADR
jgi:hypothetical protein